MSLKKYAITLYLINLTLLATHEIDSAYWNEWKLFNLPGGIDFFLIINFLLLFLFIYGFARVVTWDKGAFVFSYFLAASGLFAFIVHSYFLWTGHTEFNTIISRAILLLIFLVSAAQIIALLMIYQKKST